MCRRLPACCECLPRCFVMLAACTRFNVSVYIYIYIHIYIYIVCYFPMRQLYDNFIVVLNVLAHIRIQNCNERTNALAEFRFVSTNELAASRLVSTIRVGGIPPQQLKIATSAQMRCRLPALSARMSWRLPALEYKCRRHPAFTLFCTRCLVLTVAMLLAASRLYVMS